jgi:hypothetical protein
VTGAPTVLTGAGGRRRLGITFVALAAALGITASACSSSPTEGALAGKSATAILSLSVTAYHHQKSVHFATTTVAGKDKTVLIGASSEPAAIETVQTGSGVALLDAVLSGETGYVRGPANLLEQTFGLSSATATAYAGKWISLEKGDTGYSTVVQSLSPSAAIENFVPQEPNLKVGGVSQFAGQTAVAVEGSPTGQAPAGGGAGVTMFVSTSAPYLPLGATLTVDNANGSNAERVAAVYGKWNENVDPTVPKDATPLSTLTG